MSSDKSNSTNKFYVVELQGLEPWTSSMPWKHSSQLSYSPVPIYSSKNSPLLTEASFLSCYAPTRGAMFVSQHVCFNAQWHPIGVPAYALLCRIHNNHASIYANTSIIA